MQDHFLFDSDDHKQCGVDCDRLGSKEDGLKYDWVWGLWKGCSTKPGQCCRADIGAISHKTGDIIQVLCPLKLVVVFWHSSYEARVEMDGHLITHNINVRRDCVIPNGALITRLGAQKKAEELLITFYNEFGKLINNK